MAASEKEILKRIESLLRQRFVLLTQDITPLLVRIFRRHGMSVLTQAKVGAELYALIDHQAIRYAQERAGELIRDFAKTTPDMLRATIVKALEERWSAGQLRDELLENHGFSHVRALAIARTETQLAHRAGGRVAARALQVDEKMWDTSPTACPLCLENQAQGWISIDDDFVNGDHPHPNCSCVERYRKASAEETEAAA